jgi:hypothetical protein
MFEVIGIIALWIIGLAAAVFAPVVTSAWWARTGDGLSDLAVGVFFGRIAAVAYIIATVAYLAIT